MLETIFKKPVYIGTETTKTRMPQGSFKVEKRIQRIKVQVGTRSTQNTYSKDGKTLISYGAVFPIYKTIKITHNPQVVN